MMKTAIFGLVLLSNVLASEYCEACEEKAAEINQAAYDKKMAERAAARDRKRVQLAHQLKDGKITATNCVNELNKLEKEGKDCVVS